MTDTRDDGAGAGLTMVRGCVVFVAGRDAWLFLTWFDPDTGSINEDFLVSAFAQEPRPLVWRHVAFQFDVQAGGWSTFIDGHFVFDTARHGTTSSGGAFTANQTVATLLSGVLPRRRCCSLSQAN